eukprot:238784_1
MVYFDSLNDGRKLEVSMSLLSNEISAPVNSEQYSLVGAHATDSNAAPDRLLQNTIDQSYKIINTEQIGPSQSKQITLLSSNITENNATHDVDNINSTNIPSGSISSSVLNLMNTVIGAGILGFPSVINETGYILGAFLFIFIATLTSFSLHLNMICAKTLIPTASYITLCRITIPKLRILVDITVIIVTWGSACAYLVVIGDLLPDIVHKFDDNPPHYLGDRKFWIFIYFIILIVPFSFLRKMDALKYASFFAIASYILVIIMVVLYSLHSFNIFNDIFNPCYDDKCNGTIKAFPARDIKDILSFFKALPVYMFAFVCHSNTFPVVNELKYHYNSNTNNNAAINKIIMCTMIFCTILYCMVGFAGYFTYGSHCTSDLLNIYPQNSYNLMIVRLSLSIAVSMSYPLAIHPCRHSLASAIFNVKNADYPQLSYSKFVFLTLLFLSTSIMVAMITDNLGLVLGIVGSTGTSLMMFIVPPLFYLNIKNERIYNDPYYKCKRYCSIGLLITGCVFIPFCITMQLI